MIERKTNGQKSEKIKESEREIRFSFSRPVQRETRNKILFAVLFQEKLKRNYKKEKKKILEIK